MLRRAVLRAAQSLAILLAIAALTFALLAVAPADPARLVAGRGATAATVASVRHAMGLDRPLPVQFGSFLAHLAQGDLGRSYAERAPVATLIASRLGPSAELLGAGILAELLLGLPLAMLAAARPGGIADRALLSLAFLGASVPQFVLALALLTVLAARLGWFPVGGTGGVSHLVLPALTLGLGGAGWYGRVARGALGEVLRQNFIEAVRARGASPARVLLVHAARNAALPVLAMIGVDLGAFASGAVVVETVFGWPGIGQLTWQAIQHEDVPVIMGVTLLAAAVVVAANLAVDLAAPFVDPRLRSARR